MESIGCNPNLYLRVITYIPSQTIRRMRAIMQAYLTPRIILVRTEDLSISDLFRMRGKNS
jgi:hypothetical protein